MNENIIDHLRCSPLLWSTEDHKTPQKRQKLNPLRPSSLHNTSSGDSLLNYEGKYRRLEAELEIIRARLYQSEITAMRLHKVRKEIEEIFEREKIVLQMQVKSDNELIEQLREELEVATKRAEEAREAEVAAESEMFQMKTTMEQQVSELLLEIARLKELISSNCENTPTPSESQGDDAEVLKKKLKTAEETIIRMNNEMEENQISRTDFNARDAELEHARIVIQRLNSERISWEEREADLMSRAKDLEQQQESLKNVISTFTEAVKHKDFLEGKMHDELKDKLMLEQHVNILQKKCEELSSKQSSATCKDISPYHQTESLSMEGVRLTYRFDDVRGEFQKLEAESERAMKIGGDVHETNKEELDGKSIKGESLSIDANEEVPWQVLDGDQFSSDTPSVGVVEDLEKIDPKQPRKPILLIRVADNYFVLPSNPKFFTIDWENEYTRNAPHKYVCNRCQVVEQFKTKMEDHVWVKHYYECYKCPTCYIHRPSSLQSRYSIRRHVKQFHPHLFKCRESKQ